MKTTGIFNYYMDGEKIAADKVVASPSSILINGTDIHYVSKDSMVEPLTTTNKLLKQIDDYQNINGGFTLGGDFPNNFYKNHTGIDVLECKAKIGAKESEGKLNYELDWEFIQQMAERMSQNKGKYEPYNWKKPMEVDKLKQSLFRHVIEVMKGNYSDDGNTFGHVLSIALNAMMIKYQLER